MLSGISTAHLALEKHRSRIRYLSEKNSRILTKFPKLKKFVKIRKKFVKCPSGRGLPTTTEEYDAFHGFMLIKIKNKLTKAVCTLQ